MIDLPSSAPRKGLKVDTLAVQQVSCLDAEHSLPFFAVISLGEEGVWLISYKNLPRFKKGMSEEGNGYKMVRVNAYVGDIVCRAIEAFQDTQKGGEVLQPFTFIVAWCLSNGFDLIGTGIFDWDKEEG